MRNTDGRWTRRSGGAEPQYSVLLMIPNTHPANEKSPPSDESPVRALLVVARGGLEVVRLLDGHTSSLESRGVVVFRARGVVTATG
jgi:hypothetical protein